ncbi:fungal specific transcription factor domain-containing protein, partial [Candidatus Bathyarchaeota archaeon]|nr:fungal specific transcription factor domain-containing protein [Candidatus Bathyarchaeota archaeon]
MPHDRRIAQRMNRLEALMERLVDQVQPAGRAPPSERTSASRESPSVSAYDSGVQFSGSASDADYTSANLSIDDVDAPGTIAISSASGKMRSVGGALFEVYPTQHDVEIILASPTGSKIAESLLYSEHDIATGRAESLCEVLQRPPPHAHPVVVAKRLLYFALCLQHMSPSFDPAQLDALTPAPKLAAKLASAVGTLVCLDDDLVCCAEGLEVLSLHMMCHVNVGNLRKAWLAVRRALSLGDLMWANTQGRLAALQYCDPASDPLKRPRPAVVWFNLNYFERYLSLLLGLPTASHDDAFRMMGLATELSPREKLKVANGLITGRVIARNLSGVEDYLITLEIDCELKRAAEEMPAAWWASPGDTAADPDLITDEGVTGDIGSLILQSRHYNLVMMLHLPYVLRSATEPRWDYSKTACLAASREVLARYARFRRLYGQRMS